jgi:beta-lactam-binding protein with PASTA domain
MKFQVKDVFKAENYYDILRHIGMMMLVTFLLLIIFFYVLLPMITNHGESITVPDITGLAYDDLDEFLTERNLRFEANTDSGYSAEFPPLTVLKQYPEGGQKVKENRKIYITLNAKHPPNVKMPRLIDGSLKNAEIVLESFGLIRGHISYKPDPAQNAVLQQLYNGKPIIEGALIPKGSQIDLIVGDGYGKQVFTMPDLIGMELDEARVMILGSGLQIGEITFVTTDEPGGMKVLSQQPASGKSVKVNSTVDLWVTEPGQDN